VIAERLGRLKRDIRLYGLFNAVRLNAIPLSNRLVVEGLARRAAMPSLYRFLVGGARFYCSGESLLSDVAIAPLASESTSIREEFGAAMDELRTRYELISTSSTTYPADWAIETDASLFLYSLIRIVKPGLVVETGVANGHSTFLILRALRENGRGRCLSVDLSDSVGALLKEDERSNWQLHVLDRRHPRRAFVDYLSSLGCIDIFVHDSEHTYSWQMLEYRAAFENLRTGTGYLISDDVDSSYAFLDFCRTVNALPSLLLGSTKALGIIAKTI
jgi:cephalosporin hydroxylase